jgi:hypothetical protein
MLVEALIREYLELKVKKVVRVRELCLAGLGQLQLIQILVKVKYTPLALPNRQGMGLGFGSGMDPDLIGHRLSRRSEKCIAIFISSKD